MELCEWNPLKNCPATSRPDGSDRAGCTREAIVSVGIKPNWHLCSQCADLPAFRKFRRRIPLKRCGSEWTRAILKRIFELEATIERVYRQKPLPEECDAMRMALRSLEARRDELLKSLGRESNP
jgi:hypothetical protein